MTPEFSDQAPVAARPSRVRDVARHALVLSALGIAVAYGSAFTSGVLAAAGPWLMAVSLPVVMLSLMTLGAVRDGRRLGVLAVPFAVAFVLVLGGFLLALGLPPDAAGDPLWFGLPRRAAVIVYGVGVIPLFILPIAYALTFEATTLTQADIERVRATRRPGVRTGGHGASAPPGGEA